MSSLKYIQGDITSISGEDHKIIIQINNDIGAYGAGFSGVLSRKWPKVKKEYKKWYWSQEKFTGGEIQIVEIENNLVVINMIAQHGIMAKEGDQPLRLDQLEQCLEQVAKVATENNSSIHTVRIGAGLAAGCQTGYNPEVWSKVEKLLIEKLVDVGINVTVYDLPK